MWLRNVCCLLLLNFIFIFFLFHLWKCRANKIWLIICEDGSSNNKNITKCQKTVQSTVSCVVLFVTLCDSGMASLMIYHSVWVGGGLSEVVEVCIEIRWRAEESVTSQIRMKEMKLRVVSMNWGHRIDNNCTPHSDGRDVKGRRGG